jgi:hypothetical protein
VVSAVGWQLAKTRANMMLKLNINTINLFLFILLLLVCDLLFA